MNAAIYEMHNQLFPSQNGKLGWKRKSAMPFKTKALFLSTPNKQEALNNLIVSNGA